MKKTSYNYKIAGIGIALFLSFILSLNAFAEEINFSVNFEPEFEAKTEIIDEEEVIFTKISLNGQTCLYEAEEGAAAIPYVKKFIALPDGANITSVEVIVGEITELNEILLYPQPRHEIENIEVNGNVVYKINEVFYFNEALYQENVFLPEDFAKQIEVGSLRSQTILELDVYPLKYNPQVRRAELATQIEVQVRYDVDGKSSSNPDKLNHLSGLAKALVVNAQDIEDSGQDSASGTRGNVQLISQANLRNSQNDIDYLIITHNDFIASQLNDLANYRATRDDLNVGAVKVNDIYAEFPEDEHCQSIRDFVYFAYHNWLTAPSYLLLVGDTDKVPTYIGISPYAEECPNDDWYAYVSGEDLWPDMAVGRISVNSNGDIANIADKIMAYEADFPASSAGYHDNAAILDSFNDPDYHIANRFLHANFETAKLWTGEEYNYEDDVLPAFRSNLVFENSHGAPNLWCDLGWPLETNGFHFYLDYIDDLYNTGEHPIVLSLACSTADIDHNAFAECLAEKFVNVQDKGAVAYYGAGCTIPMNNIYQGVIKAILDEFKYKLGEAIMLAELTYGGDGWDQAQMLIGDPALHCLGHRLDSDKPDLTLASTDFDYDVQSNVFSMTIRNLGPVAAVDVPVKVVVADEVGNTTEWINTTILNVPAKSYVNRNITPAMIPGNEYRCKVTIDAENIIDESFKINNTNGRVINTSQYSTIYCREEVSGGFDPVANIRVDVCDLNGDVLAQDYTDPLGRVDFQITEGTPVKLKAYSGDLLAAEVEGLVAPLVDEVILLERSVATLYDGHSAVRNAEIRIFSNGELLGKDFTDSNGDAVFYAMSGLPISLEVWYEGALSNRMNYSVEAPFELDFNLAAISVLRFSDSDYGIGIPDAEVKAYDAYNNLITKNVVTNSNGFANMHLLENEQVRFEVWFENEIPDYSFCLAAQTSYSITPYDSDLHSPGFSQCTYFNIGGSEVTGLDVVVLDSDNNFIGEGQTGASFCIRPGECKFQVEVAEEDYRYSENIIAPAQALVNAYALNITSDLGHVDIVPNKATYTSGETVTIVAKPSADYIFSRWRGDLDCLNGSEYDNPVAVIMQGSDTKKELIADYIKDIFGPSAPGQEPGSGNVKPYIGVISGGR